MDYHAGTCVPHARDLHVVHVSVHGSQQCLVCCTDTSSLRSYARNLFIPPSHYGIGDVRDVRTLENALNSASGGRNRLVLVNSGGGDASNGDIASVIQSITAIANTTSAHVYNLDSDADLTNICRSSLRGVSQCIAAAVFHSSPTEGGQGKWNYTIRADGALDTKIVVADTNNDAEIYILPLQRAIDRAIAEVEGSGTQALSGTMQSFPYTSITQEERETEIRVKYMGAIIDILGVAYLIGLIGISYQLTGLVAAERESGMSQLIDCMMPNMARWQPQFARIVSHHLALDVIYLPGWVFAAIILGLNVWKDTNLGIQIIFHVLAGLALSSFAMFGASFFKRAQLSGITSVIVSLLLGVLAQVIGKSGTGIVSILGLLFPPMNYVFFVLLMSRWERRELGVNLLKAAPENPWSTPGIALWLFFVIQIIGYPLLGALIERFLYGTVSEGRKIIRSDESNVAVELDNFTKEYKPNWWFTHVAPKFGRASSSVLAVDKVNITAMKGQILVLLGANGSGKSTTLDAVCGLSKVTSGEIRINYTDGTGGLGYCPQKNVLWDDLTVEEHVRIFNALKTTGPKDSKAQISDLISACDLGHKYSAHSKTLSGGQKRKLQLAMMFTGGSNVCAVDEISSGVDPLSRRKIWDILLAERGARTIILTTHFLDEADLLSDKIAMLSRGVLKADGSAVELKHTMGSGYRVHVYNVPGAAPLPTFEGVDQKVSYDQTVYNLPSSAEAATFVAKLEEHGIKEYQVSGPTIEDVFLKVAEEVRLQDEAEKGLTSPLDGEDAAPKLVTGKRIGLPRQTWVLFTKRLVILRRNWLPYLAALFIPIIAAGLVTFFIKDSPRPGCTPSEEYNVRANSSFLSLDAFELVAGPTSKVTTQALELFVKSVNAVNGTNMAFNTNLTAVANNTVFVDTYAQFNNFVDTFFANVTPGGFYLGDASHDPTFAWQADESIWYASTMLNALDVMLSNLTIGFQYQAFDVPWAPSTGKALQMIVYFGLAMAVYPAFFTLYPTLERLRSVRALHYSNGVRSFPLWAAYLLFDFCFVVLISIVNVIIFRAVSDDWYHLEYLLAVLILYGMASALISYVISLMARSQLAAFAFAAGGQASMFLIYIIGYLVVLTYAPANKVDDYVNIVHFVIAALTPSGNLVRALFVSRNLFSILCRGDKVVSHPATLTVFGGPILYLILQSLLLFGLLLWWDNGFISFLPKRAKEDDTEDRNTSIEEVSNELARVKDSDDGLRIIHLSKQFGKNLAVDDVSFGVGKSEVFALLGPNGAGKSTTISLIRGDIQPSDRGGEILVEGVSIAKHRAAARAFLGGKFSQPFLFVVRND